MAENKNRSFLTDFESFRDFLRVNFYFCSIPAEKIGDYLEKIGKTKYSEYKNKAEVIGNNRIRFPKINGKKAFKYDQNQFESDYNELADSFQLKTLTAYEANSILLLLVFLAQTPASKNDILNVFCDYQEKALEKHLKSMTEYGLLKKEKTIYSVSENPFLHMAEDDLLKLINYVDFMKNIASPQALGYFLFNSLKSLYTNRTGKDYNSPFQFHYSHLANILDDHVLWTLINAIQNRRWISYTYKEKQKQMLIPVKIFTENEYNRTYLFGVNRYNKMYILRLSKMYDVEIKKESVSAEAFSQLLQKYEAMKTCSFSGKLDSANRCTTVRLKFHGAAIKKQMEHDFGSVTFLSNNIAEVTITKKSLIIPWLRSNVGKVDVLDEALSEQIKNDITEMKKLYGIIS